MGMQARSENMLSIVIPIHKSTEELTFLETSIRRARNSSLPVEFILIQDGQNYELESRLEFLAREYDLLYVTVDNSSPGLTRNTGLKLASSEWVTFWDCDDIGHAKEILKALEDVNPSQQIVIGNFCINNFKTKQITYCRMKWKKLESLMVNPGLWRFVFRNSFVENEKFSELRMGEDQLFLCKLRMNHSIIKFADEVFYTYSKNIQGQLTSNSEAKNDLILAVEELSRLTMDDTYALRYIFVVQIKLLMTAVLNRKIGIRQIPKLLLSSKKKKLLLIWNLLIGLFYVSSTLLLRNL